MRQEKVREKNEGRKSQGKKVGEKKSGKKNEARNRQGKKWGKKKSGKKMKEEKVREKKSRCSFWKQTLRKILHGCRKFELEIFNFFKMRENSY